MKKRILAFLAAIAVMGVVLVPQTVSAAAIKEGVDNSCSPSFLGLRPWHRGLSTNKGGQIGCTVGEPDDIRTFVWTIVLNILADLFLVVGYAAIIYMIYGGWFYLRSEGDPSMLAKGKKTLVSAAIGAGIALLATVIVNTISGLLLSAAGGN